MIIKKIIDVKKDVLEAEGIKGVSRQILIGHDDGSDNIIMRLFSVEPGGHSPHHTHDYEHLVKIEEGEGIAVDCNGEHRVKAGDILYVKPGEKHQFRNDTDSIFKFICIIPGYGK